MNRSWLESILAAIEAAGGERYMSLACLDGAVARYCQLEALPGPFHFGRIAPSKAACDAKAFGDAAPEDTHVGGRGWGAAARSQTAFELGGEPIELQAVTYGIGSAMRHFIFGKLQEAEIAEAAASENRFRTEAGRDSVCWGIALARTAWGWCPSRAACCPAPSGRRRARSRSWRRCDRAAVPGYRRPLCLLLPRTI